MVALLSSPDGQDLVLKGPDTTTVILMMGLQGSGKTTTAAKLAYRLQKQGRRVLLAACDLVRPAAILQLKVLGDKAGVPVYMEEGAKKPDVVAVNALRKARKEQYNVMIVDTSGRMYLDEALMDELARIKDAVKPDETLFVADAMTGQGAVTIAKEFESKIGISGVVLTKFDSDTRGGAAMSLRSVVGNRSNSLVPERSWKISNRSIRNGSPAVSLAWAMSFLLWRKLRKRSARKRRWLFRPRWRRILSTCRIILTRLNR